MNNPMEFMQMLSGCVKDPTRVLESVGLNRNAMQNPEAAIQQLMNSGRVTQQQFNMAQTAVNNMMQNPIFKKIFG